jgi:small-conductance mechanosensitive channel
VVLKWLILILMFLAFMAVMAIVVEAEEYEHHELSRRRFKDMVLWLLFVAALVLLVVWYFYDPKSGSALERPSQPSREQRAIP